MDRRFNEIACCTEVRAHFFLNKEIFRGQRKVQTSAAGYNTQGVMRRNRNIEAGGDSRNFSKGGGFDPPDYC